MTERLFWLDPYMKAFEARVISVSAPVVVLDRTCFYPRGGGQIGDTGRLGGAQVVETRWDNEKVNVLHVVESTTGVEPGMIIRGEIDWCRRFQTMRNHAASHIMEFFLKQRCPSLELVYSSVGPEGDVSKYKGPDVLDGAVVKEIEQQVKTYVARHLPIECIEDSLRAGYWHWRCGEITMPCGGTHPRNTSEIGDVRITLKDRKGQKISILTVAQ